MDHFWSRTAWQPQPWTPSPACWRPWNRPRSLESSTEERKGSDPKQVWFDPSSGGDGDGDDDHDDDSEIPECPATSSCKWPWNLLNFLEILKSLKYLKSWDTLSILELFSDLVKPVYIARAPLRPPRLTFSRPNISNGRQHCCFSFLSFGSEFLPHPKHVWS